MEQGNNGNAQTSKHMYDIKICKFKLWQIHSFEYKLTYISHFKGIAKKAPAAIFIEEECWQPGSFHINLNYQIAI
jgi:hypothetical protein